MCIYKGGYMRVCMIVCVCIVLKNIKYIVMIMQEKTIDAQARGSSSGQTGGHALRFGLVSPFSTRFVEDGATIRTRLAVAFLSKTSRHITLLLLETPQTCTSAAAATLD